MELWPDELPLPFSAGIDDRIVYELLQLPEVVRQHPDQLPQLNHHQEPIRKKVVDEHQGIRFIDVQGGPGAGKSWLILRIAMETE